MVALVLVHMFIRISQVKLKLFLGDFLGGLVLGGKFLIPLLLIDELNILRCNDRRILLDSKDFRHLALKCRELRACMREREEMNNYLAFPIS